MRSATAEKPKMWGPSIIGFGSYHYKYDSGREGNMPIIGFSPRKATTVLYNVGGFSGSEALRAKLGKHATGKGCLYIKKLAEADQQVFETPGPKIRRRHASSVPQLRKQETPAASAKKSSL